MATIFQKTATDNCIVLDSRESLTYPFSLGNWSEIRLGIEMSIVAITGGYNTVGTDETVGGTSQTNSFYFGFKNTGTLFPDTISGFFVGVIPNGVGANYTAAPGGLNGRLSQASTADLNWGIQSGSTSRVGPLLDTSSRHIWAGGDSVANSTLYCSRQGLRVILISGNTTNQFLQLDTFNNSTTDYTPNITGLRSFMDLMANSSSGTYQFLTNGFVGGGAPLPFPNAFFIYNPFISNQIRIHTLVVERYA